MEAAERAVHVPQKRGKGVTMTFEIMPANLATKYQTTTIVKDEINKIDDQTVTSNTEWFKMTGGLGHLRALSILVVVRLLFKILTELNPNHD